MRNRFDEQLERLNVELTEMGALIEEAITLAVRTLTTGDERAAEKAIEADNEVAHKEKVIEQLCFKLLLHQQPVATDLRTISAALKMITDMERIGDQAADITDLARIIASRGANDQLDLIPQMAEETVGMVKNSIDAFVRRDVELAVRVCKSDDVVDGLVCKIKDDIVELIQTDCHTGEQALDMLMVGK